MSENNEEEIVSAPRRAMVFDFETNEIDQEPELIDNTDTTDYVAKTAKKSKNKKTAIMLALIILIALIGYGIYYIINNNANSHLEKPEPPTPTITDTAEPAPTNHPTDTIALNPIEESYPDAPEVVAGEEVATVVNSNAIMSTNGKTLLTTAPATVEPAKIECKVNKATDFCLAGVITFNETLTTDVYYMKDAAHSRLFEKYKNYEQLEIQGASTSGTLDITLAGTKTVIVVVTDNSSGFMIVMPDDNTASTQTVTDNIMIAELE